MKTSYLLFLPLLLIQLIACDPNTDKNTDKFPISKYELVKADSIMVDYMENINILDFDNERNIILGYNSRSGDFIEFDLNGKILNEVNLVGQGPNDYGRNSYQVNYLGGGRAGVAAIGRYFIYNEDWNVESKVDFDYKAIISVMGGGGYIAFGNPQLKDTSNPYVSIPGAHFLVTNKEDIKNPHLFHLNTVTGEGDYFHQFPDSSIFVQSNEFYPQAMETVTSYNHEVQVLDVVHHGEAILYRYDISDATPMLITSFRFDYDNPKGLKGISFDTQGVSLMNAGGLISEFNQKITGLYSFEDKQLIIYRERNPLSDVISPNEENPEKLREFYDAPTKSWAYLIKDGKRISENMPIGSPRIALQLGKGRFLSTRYVDPEVERDTQLYYIYELREVGN